jgi:hypothetical protein
MAGRTFINGKEILAAEDLTLTDDLIVGDDATITDDTDIGGTLTLSTDGKIVTTGNGDLTLLPHGTGITIVGDAGSANRLGTPTNDDMFIAGRLEVDGVAAFDNTAMMYSSLQLQDNISVNFGGSNDSRVDWSTAQATSNTVVWGLGDTSKSIIFCDSTDRNKDFDHAAQSNPTPFGHSARDPDESNTEWWSKTHDGDDAIYGVGKGGHVFKTDAQKARGTMTLTGIPVADETFVINATTITAKADGSGDVDHFTIGGTAAETVTNIVATLAECSESANLTAWDGAGDTVVVEWGTAGTAGNAIVFTEALTNATVDGAGTLGTTHAGVAAATLAEIQESKNAKFYGKTDIGDGGSTNYAQFAADGELTFAGTARVTKSIDIENANLGKGASAPTEVIVGNFAVWEFGVNDDAVFDIVVPHDYASGTDMTFNVVWQINEAGGDEVQWQIDYESIPADSTQAIGGAGTQVKSGDVVVPATVRYLTETPMTIAAANIAANEHCGITLKRIAIDDGVAPGVEPGVVDVHIEYISDKLGEAT